jgi:hypothetical protein
MTGCYVVSTIYLDGSSDMSTCGYRWHNVSDIKGMDLGIV